METALTTWHPPYLSGNFEEDIETLREACRSEVMGRVAGQFVFSHMLRTGEWEQPQVWWNPYTGEAYEDERMIPPNERVHVALRQRWTAQEDFIAWCGENVMGFARSTFWERHRVIDLLAETTHIPFPEAVWIVTGVRVLSGARLVAGIFKTNRDHTLEGLKTENAMRLPTLPLETKEALEAGDTTEETLEQVREAATAYIREQAHKVESGKQTAQQITVEVRRDLENAPVVKCRLVPEEGYALFITRGEGYNVEKEVYYVRFLSASTGEIAQKLPPDVDDWWQRRMSLKR